jgi:AraC-like DNA-binding protein
MVKEWVYNERMLNDEDENHRHQNEEMDFYNQVARGNVEAVEKNCREQRFLDGTGVGMLSRDPIQNLKYHIVVTVAIISRLCIDYGMEMEKSYRLSDFYIRKLDDLKTQEQIVKLHDRLVMDYTKRMRTIRQSAGYSRPVVECMNYIYSHIKERITIEDLAAYTHNSASYISKLFKEELDISPSDYIRNAKLESAKNLLRYSDYSLVDISNYLSFSSQSHFIQVFQKEVGLTPKKYREKYYGTQWKGTVGDLS